MKPAPQNPAWTVPDWPAPPNVHALCTVRQGGCSAAPFDSFNLGDHVGDDPGAVAANRQRLQAGIAAVTPGAQTIFLQQLHGTQVLSLDVLGTQRQAADSPAPCADASMASTPGRVCTIMVADCLPVLLTNRQGSVVAAVHAGWRGLAGVSAGVCAAGPAAGFADPCANPKGIVESTLASFWALAQQQQALAAIKSEAFEGQTFPTDLPAQNLSSDTLAWLGPCIGPRAFEVGEEVRAAFCDHNAAAAQHFQPIGPAGTGKYLADLAALARQRLTAAGVKQIHGNDSTAAWCTAGNPSRFFSHRRDSIRFGTSGRFAVCIWRS